MGNEKKKTEKSNWISVKDELPDTDAYVLVFCKIGAQRIRLSWYSTHSNRWMDYIDVTHWQKLPEFPDGEAE